MGLFKYSILSGCNKEISDQSFKEKWNISLRSSQPIKIHSVENAIFEVTTASSLNGEDQAAR